jgi:hypothetical protein
VCAWFACAVGGRVRSEARTQPQGRLRGKGVEGVCVVATLSCTTPKANKCTSNTNRKKPKTSDWFHEQHNTQQQERRGGRSKHALAFACTRRPRARDRGGKRPHHHPINVHFLGITRRMDQSWPVPRFLFKFPPRNARKSVLGKAPHPVRSATRNNNI